MTGNGRPILWLSWFTALALTALPLPAWAEIVRPAWVVLAVSYWAMALPERVSLGTAWTLGLLLDVLKGAMLGQHALALTVSTYLLQRSYLQIRNFPVWQQGLVVGMVLALYEFIIYALYGFSGTAGQGWRWPAALVGALLWPAIFNLLRGLRRRYQIA